MLMLAIFAFFSSSENQVRMQGIAEIASQQSEIIHSIDTVWVALCAALIFQMEGGFALLEAGFIRSKNSMSIIAKVIIDITFGGIHII